MKSAIIALAIFGCAYAVSDELASVVRNEFELAPQGNFQYGFETENGIRGQASGLVKTLGKDEVALEVTGENQYISPDGEVIKLSYIADENGYQPKGDHLPTPPAPLPIPEYIARALKYIAENPYFEEKQ